ncbi:MAG TPA: sigma-54 dependent transcriptional regulator [Thermoanaerobaculia bacterium]|nr:sigma-54 dependent transcriptional regulator [Thermoanaerobaculia bacterium]
MARVLVADDDPSFRALLRDVLEGAGHAVTEARDGEEALLFLRRETFQLVLADQRMPKLDGLALLRKGRSEVPALPPFVLLTAFGTIPEAVEAVRLGAADYLTKPLESPRALLALAGRLLAPEAGEPELVTGDPRMRELLELVDRVAAADVPVLVLGESGTGKELVARRVHARSRRATGPFVAVNAAAFPETLADSELFGHEKGAFTGADRARAGRFEEASGGTLFLDEVGELTPALQAKLLRVLEERIVRRVGSERDVPVDVRVLAATNRDLAREAESGSFRRDLYFRLAVVPVVLPPLRDRPGDVERLSRHFVARLAARHRVPAPELTEAALAALEAHPWPGNVRELRNTLESAVVIRAGQPIRPEDLRLAPPPAGLSASALDEETRSREATLEALRRGGGNREEAARLLGISVRTLYYRLRRWGLN